MNKKILFAALLAATLSVGAGAAGFNKTGTYTQGQFTDVPGTEWYASEVAGTYELGLMNGVGGGLFSPDGNVTVAEAITMASRASAIYAGETIDTASTGEWYTPYVNYAAAKGIIKADAFDNYDRAATRSEVAVIFKNALPTEWFTAKNDVKSIPDVPEKSAYAADLLTLYKAGVVMGSDSYGNFFPENNITRAEAAAIVNRVALPESRLVKALDKISDDDAYLLINTPEMKAPREGINSGWLVDTRGGIPRLTIANVTGLLTDIRSDAPTALIREFNPTTTGKLVLEANISVNGSDGIYAAFRNTDDKNVYHLEFMNGIWKIADKNGAFTDVYEVGELERGFIFRIELDIDNNRAATYINGKNTGTYPLCGDIADGIINFRFGTTDTAENVAVNVLSVRSYVNYAVNDTFKYDANGKTPFGYSGDATVLNGEVLLNTGSFARSFDPVSGNIVAETMFLLPQAQDMTVTLASGSRPLVTFSAQNGDLYAGQTLLVKGFEANMWHRLRIEANTDTQTVIVKLNGKKVGEVPFASPATSADTLTMTTFGEPFPEGLKNEEIEALRKAAPHFDNIKIFRTVEHEDYVPKPTAPAGEDKYTVGMNVCSLWQNGTSYGWSCITPYDDIRPVLGYYDEGNPETADWEIKYLVEHGIDFQAFCVFPDKADAPLKMDETAHLYDGFMNAKYADMSHFSVIWEASAGQKPKTMEAWKTYFVPYFIENYFKDPRYVTVDNRPILCVFGAGAVSSAIGSDENVKEMFDYLENEVKKLGFDGMIFLACGNSSERLAAMGFDGCYAYNWGKEGYTFEHNRKSILVSADNKAVYTVPTVSVGFNSIAWEGSRFPLMSAEEYRTSHTWVRDEYLKEYPKEDWQKNFVMLSTWNEYGEGTYIMPTSDEKGFGYLDVLREIYTDEKASASVNTIPSAEQLVRINRLYPQYRRLLRKEGYYTASLNEDTLTEKMSLNLDPNQGNGAIFWVSDSAAYDDKNGLADTSHGNDPQIIVPASLPDSLQLQDISALRILADIPSGERFQIFFATEENPGFSESRVINCRSDAGMLKEYVIPTSGVAGWAGKLTRIRIDPVETQGVHFQIASVKFLASPERVSKDMRINGQAYTMSMEPQKATDGQILIPFEPALALDFRLGLFHLWDKQTGTLTLQNPSHTVVYHVGTDTYTFDGQEKPLGFLMTTLDGLPLVPIEALCKDMGYTMRKTDNVFEIETYQNAYLTDIPEPVSGIYEFNHPGYDEGWESDNTTLLTADGSLRAETFAEGEKDQTLWKKLETPLAAVDYTKIELRVRYRYEADSAIPMQMFFITDKNRAWSESQSLKVLLNSTDSGGEWETYTFDMASCAKWTDTVTNLRFDPFNASGFMEIDYIRIVK